MFSERLKAIALYPALDRFLAGFFLMMTAIVIGYLTAVWAIGATRPAAADLYGPWKLQTLGGEAQKTPYSEARLAREGPFVLPPEEIAVFVARRDADNRPLSGACNYRISGAPIDARWWTLSAYTPEKEMISLPGTHPIVTREALSPPVLESLLSEQIMVEALQPDLSIRVSSDTGYEPWLAVNADQRFLLVLRLYGASGRVLSGEDGNALPKIVREQCP